MGAEVEHQEFTRADRARHRAKVRECLAAVSRMVAEDRFVDSPCTGLEMELNLVDGDGQPALRNAEVLALLEDPDFVTELGQFNLEINVPPRRIDGDGLAAYEEFMRGSLNRAEERAAELDVHLVAIGVLPTLAAEHVGASTISANPRYQLLNDAILAERGEDLALDITGAERLVTTSETIMPEAACTSVQLHVQVAPEDFGQWWNASQAISGVQVALGANSPYLLGRELWAESRVPLFQQATDTRSEELKVQGVRPRVWFGEGWCEGGVVDLFTENATYFAGLLPVVEDEDPAAVLDAGGVPELPELLMHSSTIWRWNRPVYDVLDGEAHLRVENRVLPAGPTVLDTTANAAFFFGLARGLAVSDRPPWHRMPFAAAEAGFENAARHGIDAEIYWPGAGEVAATELTLRRLLPIAHEGLRQWGVDGAVADRYLGVIEGRCTAKVNGASWFVEKVHAAQERGMGRADALRGVLGDYRAAMHANEPVHTWG